MTTTYYTFHTRKVKVSGGADLLTLVPVAQPETTPLSADGKILAPKAFGGKLPGAQSEDPTGPKAEILDFDLCRKHVETKNAWQSLAHAAREDEEDDPDTRWEAVEWEEEVDSRKPSSQEKTANWLELCASAAVIITALSAAIAFLSLV